MLGAFRKAHEGGVRIAFGTDAGVSPHGENAQEFALMVEAGMNPMEAIRSATVTAAALLDLSKEIGTLEAGKAGDVIAARGDPLTDIRTLEHVTFVMRDGAVLKTERPK
jgi:imidazolonepropionase-like amidohydrolase